MDRRQFLASVALAIAAPKLPTQAVATSGIKYSVLQQLIADTLRDFPIGCFAIPWPQCHDYEFTRIYRKGK